ncbi:QRFP-like peptide receptor [Babylonia areolata]|uniref:QRFP-like peptide receptor n=1 Tax=Babylonia areolata TaxID=304850 RepID=UPI003FD0DFB9
MNKNHSEILQDTNNSHINFPLALSFTNTTTFNTTFNLSADASLTPKVTSCNVGEVAPQSPPDPDLFKVFRAPSQPPDLPAWEMGLKIGFYALAFLVAVAGNGLVIFVICRNRRMRSTTNLLLLNQAVSDLMVAAVCMWVHLGNSITPEWPFGNLVCKVNTFCQVVAVTSSVLTLTVITVERFMAILFPLRGRWSRGSTGAVIGLTWVAAVLVASPHLFVRRTYQQLWKDRREVWCAEDWPQVYRDEVTCDTWQRGKVVYYVVEGVVMYVVPVLIMMVAYALITLRLLTRSSPGTLISTTLSAQERAKRKVIKMLVAVLVCFVVCWSPQQYILLYGVFRPYLGLSVEEASDYHSVKYVALYVAYLNSALNPILYCGFNDNFRQGFREALHRILPARNNKVHPVVGGGKPDHRKQVERNGTVNEGNKESIPASPGPSSSSSTENNGCQSTGETKPSSTDTSIRVTDEDDDDIEDILDEPLPPSSVVSTCRRRSVQREDSCQTRSAWPEVP